MWGKQWLGLSMMDNSFFQWWPLNPTFKFVQFAANHRASLPVQFIHSGVTSSDAVPLVLHSKVYYTTKTDWQKISSILWHTLKDHLPYETEPTHPLYLLFFPFSLLSIHLQHPVLGSIWALTVGWLILFNIIAIYAEPHMTNK